MRPDVLEAMAEEIAGRPVDALASFVTWDDGRRKLDGMAKGRRWDIDREQREWDKVNRKELEQLAARRRWERFRRLNPEHMAAYRKAWAAAHPEEEKEYDRRQRARVKKDPVRLAMYKARQERYREKRNAKLRANRADPVWLARERARRRKNAMKSYTKRYKPEGKRKCTLCGKPGHNRVRCGRVQAAQ
jgi:hypothetical protein